VDEISMKAGIALAQWFGHEAKRVYAMLGETALERDRRELAELIERRGGQVTVRDMMRGPGQRRYGSAPEWEQALNDLVLAGLGRWHDSNPGPKGGHPIKVFVLTPQPKSTTPDDTMTDDRTPPSDPSNGGSVICHHVIGDNGKSGVRTGEQGP
jgi:hypothetical protein